VDASLDSSGMVQLRAASDSKLTAGLAGILVSALSGSTPEQLLEVDGTSFLQSLNLGPSVVAPSRASGAANLLASIQRRTRMLSAQLPRFPSLLITRDSLRPQGAFAEAQAQYLQPNTQQVAQLVELLRSKRIGVVAHFYMDPQVSCCCWGQQQTGTAADKTPTTAHLLVQLVQPVDLCCCCANKASTCSHSDAPVLQISMHLQCVLSTHYHCRPVAPLFHDKGACSSTSCIRQGCCIYKATDRPIFAQSIGVCMLLIMCSGKVQAVQPVRKNFACF
jgi:hypothetical protein